jgi:hypothetical protein
MVRTTRQGRSRYRLRLVPVLLAGLLALGAVVASPGLASADSYHPDLRLADELRGDCRRTCRHGPRPSTPPPSG